MNDDPRYKLEDFQDYYGKEVTATEKIQGMARRGVPEWKIRQKFPHLFEITQNNVYSPNIPFLKRLEPIKKLFLGSLPWLSLGMFILIFVSLNQTSRQLSKTRQNLSNTVSERKTESMSTMKTDLETSKTTQGKNEL